MQFAVDRDTSLRDFYYYYNPATDTFGNAAKVALAAQGQPKQESVVRDLYKDYTLLSPQEMKAFENAYLYEITFSNKGGFVMPIILQWNYTDGTSEVDYIHAYIWRKNEQKVTKNFLKHKEVASIVLDPFKETADIDESNHHWPRTVEPTRFEIFKNKQASPAEQVEMTPMKRALRKK